MGEAEPRGGAGMKLRAEVPQFETQDQIYAAYKSAQEWTPKVKPGPVDVGSLTWEDIPALNEAEHELDACIEKHGKPKGPFHPNTELSATVHVDQLAVPGSKAKTHLRNLIGRVPSYTEKRELRKGVDPGLLYCRLSSKTEEEVLEILLSETEEPGSPVSTHTEFMGIPAEREWLIPEWMPRGRVGSLVGEGGNGKSRLALQIAISIARGDPEWMRGHDVFTACDSWLPVVFITWEDEPNEVTRKMHRMESTFEPELVAQLTDRFHLLNYCGSGPLWQSKGDTFAERTKAEPTSSLHYLRAYCERHKAALLVIDPLAGAYAGSENDRGMVREFMSSWDAWAVRTGCTILMVSHPAKSNYKVQAGSTDWHAASRFVWSLGLELLPGESNRGKEKGKVASLLSCVKSSYSKVPEPLWIMGYPDWSKTSPESAHAWWSEGSRHRGQEQIHDHVARA